MVEFQLSEVEVACHVTLPAVKLARQIGLVSQDGQKFTAPNSVGPALAGAAARLALGAPAEFLGLDILGLPVYGKAELPLDPEPWTEAGFMRRPTRRACYEYPVFQPREGYNQNKEAYA